MARGYYVGPYMGVGEREPSHPLHVGGDARVAGELQIDTVENRETETTKMLVLSSSNVVEHRSAVEIPNGNLGNGWRFETSRTPAFCRLIFNDGVDDHVVHEWS
jgi:hypothetical protein